MVPGMPPPGVRPWREAWTDAVYGPDGFARRERPADHFRTSPNVSTQFAEALLVLADSIGARQVVDVGAGGGELLTALHHLAGDRLALAGVEVAERPHGLPAEIAWVAELSALEPIDGLLVANEWLDDIPVDVVVDGRRVLVDDSGAEVAGEPVGDDERAWLARWRPGARRAEVGSPRDEAWAGAIRRMRRGLAVAVDYAVPLQGIDPRHAGGTLVGYRAGAEVAAVPDGTRNLTAHVLLEACAAAGFAAGAADTVITTQREALRALGVTGARPPLAGATADPRGYLAGLARASTGCELLAEDGLGALGWLVQAIGIPMPEVINGTKRRVVAAFAPRQAAQRPTVESG